MLSERSRSDRSHVEFDPVLLSVIANRLEAIVREMTNTLLRTGRSTVINVSRDFSCSIITADNELLASSQGLPIHVVGSQYLGEAMTTIHERIEEGDAFLHNDPYYGNTHHADHSVLAPVFFDGHHYFTAIGKSHQADCGNSTPTTYAGYARDIYEEGALNFPCVRVQRQYEDVQDIIRMCRNRIRVPEQWYGDYLATLGAARTGERRLKELLAKYGTETVANFKRAWFEYSETKMVNAIRKLPSGTFRGEGAHDPVETMPDGIPIQVEITVDAEAAVINVDLRDNIDCMPNGFNESMACTMAAVVAGVFNSLPERVPHNSGSLRRLNIEMRENCAVGIPRHPASCSVATTNVADRLISVMNATFAGLGEGFGLAQGGVGMGAGMAVVAGRDGRRGEAPFVNQLFLTSMGGPGGPDEDGWVSFGVPVDGGLMYRDSAEVTEQKYPLVIDEVRLMRDSEGAGRHRGAPGSRVVYGPSSRPMNVAYLTDGHYFRPEGVRGGESPAIHTAYKLDVNGVRIDIPQVGQIELTPGERIVEEGGGGGGYGPPFERDPARVRQDVEAGLVSPERARETYAVALATTDGLTWSVDEQDTQTLREGRDVQRLDGGER
jgi:N-methylhydantoinase B